MDIPDFLKTQIKEGKVVLLLGSGASYDAHDSNDNRPPIGNGLAKMLSDKFLGGAHSDAPLDQVSDYAISESNILTVQDYIREVFEPFKPTKAHELMTTFSWEGIVTTNYDRLIEIAYERKGKNAAQQILPYIQDGDRTLDHLRDRKAVLLIKLHGCITRINNDACPLILTPDQYIDHRFGRKNLFSKLHEWGGQRSILFIGHSLRDIDLRTLLKELSDEGNDKRPRYFMVTPDADDIQKRYWESKKVTCLTATFLEFMTSLDTVIPSPFRGVQVDTSAHSHPIEERFSRKGVAMSERCKQFLDVEVDYVKDCTKGEVTDAKRFYRGFDLEWAGIEQNLDVRRSLSDEIVIDNILNDSDKDRLTVVLLRAEAGAGKTILLRRMAWDAAHDYNKLCLYLKRQGQVDAQSLQEIQNLCQERIFLFVDDAAGHIQELRKIVRSSAPEFSFLTVICAERTNEWNMVDEEAQSLISSCYDLRYLSRKEIDNLLSLLETHKSLGAMKSLSRDKQAEHFREHAGRQLLVALHEATFGKPFEEIVVDEYNSISSPEAQAIYLTICVLNRLRVGVRAGIISRIHSVSFEDFKKRFLAPLENIVFAKKDQILRDYVYTARHPVIADMVFQNVLVNQEQRFDSYIRCLKTLNTDYEADETAFRAMTKGKTLTELFSNQELVRTVFEEAQTIRSQKDPFLLQQIAIYEMHHQGGDISKAEKLLERAKEMAPYSASIKHSLAEIQIQLAKKSQTALQKERHLKLAESAASVSTGREATGSYAFHTKCKANLIRLQDTLSKSEDEGSSSEIEKIVFSIEETLAKGLQRFPNDEYLLNAESEFANLLGDSERAKNALKGAFEANPRNSWCAIRLSRILADKNEDGLAILKKALEANNSNHEIHYAYARMLLNNEDSNNEEILYHLRRSYSPGDANYEAQLLYGRQLYIMDKIDESKNVFDELKSVRMSPERMNFIRHPLSGTFQGTLSRQEVSYLWIRRDSQGDFLFSHRSKIDDDLWRRLDRNDRLSFSIGFTMKGPNAFDLKMI